MKNYFLVMMFLMGFQLQAQDSEKGAIVGRISDKQMQGEPLPFANVIIKGSTTGATTDFDGLYAIDGIEPGNYTVVFSFIGYETLEVPNVEVKAGEVPALIEVHDERRQPIRFAIDEPARLRVCQVPGHVQYIREQALHQFVAADRLHGDRASLLRQGDTLVRLVVDQSSLSQALQHSRHGGRRDP